MAKSIKAFKVVTDVIDLDIPSDQNGAMGIEYGVKGEDGATGATGTLVVEGLVQGAIAAGLVAAGQVAIAAAWYPLKIHKNDETIVDNLAAPGMGYVEVTGWDKVRLRMSVVGGAQGVIGSANFGRP